jgi:hypothetical protein
MPGSSKTWRLNGLHFNTIASKRAITFYLIFSQLRQQFCAIPAKNTMDENQKKWNEGDIAGQVPDMGIKTVQGMDHEGHLSGSNQSTFNERSAQEHERADDNELNKTDDRGKVSGTEGV